MLAILRVDGASFVSCELFNSIARTQSANCNSGSLKDFTQTTSQTSTTNQPHTYHTYTQPAVMMEGHLMTSRMDAAAAAAASSASSNSKPFNFLRLQLPSDHQLTELEVGARLITTSTKTGESKTILLNYVVSAPPACQPDASKSGSSHPTNTPQLELMREEFAVYDQAIPQRTQIEPIQDGTTADLPTMTNQPPNRIVSPVEINGWSSASAAASSSSDQIRIASAPPTSEKHETPQPIVSYQVNHDEVEEAKARAAASQASAQPVTPTESPTRMKVPATRRGTSPRNMGEGDIRHDATAPPANIESPSCTYCLIDGVACNGGRPKCRRCKAGGYACEWTNTTSTNAVTATPTSMLSTSTTKPIQHVVAGYEPKKLKPTLLPMATKPSTQMSNNNKKKPTATTTSTTPGQKKIEANGTKSASTNAEQTISKPTSTQAAPASKKRKRDSSDSSESSSSSDSDSEDSHDPDLPEDVWEVYRLVARRVVDGVEEYKVHWCDRFGRPYPKEAKDARTWVAKENLNCPEKIKAFEALFMPRMQSPPMTPQTRPLPSAKPPAKFERSADFLG